MENLNGNSELKINIKVFGIGSGGTNVINDMLTHSIKGVEFYALNTNTQELNNSKAKHRIQLGPSTTKGLGCGGSFELGELATKESLDSLKEILKGTDFLFLTSTLGGGTGSAATPMIAKLAKELGILTLAIITKPFSFEGRKKMDIAEHSIELLKDSTDSFIVIPNDKLLDLKIPNISVLKAFKKSNLILVTALKSMTDLMSNKGLINLDFADIKSILKDSGDTILGFGEASGKNSAEKAVLAAIDSTLFERTISGATKFLVNIIGSKTLSLSEPNTIINLIKEKCGANVEDVLFGVDIDENLNDTIKVILIANSFKTKEERI